MTSSIFAPMAGSTSLEFPVGAFVAEMRHIQAISEALRVEGIKKTGAQNVTRFLPNVQVENDDVEFILADLGDAEAAEPADLFAVHVVGIPSKSLLERFLRTPPVRCHFYARRLRLRDKRCGLVLGGAIPRPLSPIAAVAPSTSTQPTFIELFAGIGMFRLAGEAAGARCVFASEIAPAACAVYACNFREPPSGDVSEYPADQIPSHDILTAGFPCQSFSCAGEERNFEDVRGLLFFEVCRVLREKSPRAFLLENVANMVDMEDGRVFAIVLEALRDCGYCTTYKIIDSALVVPQRRRRVYIIGFLASNYTPMLESVNQVFDWPQELCDPSLPTKQCIADILEEHPAPDLRLTESQYALIHRRGDHAVANLSGHARTLMGSYKRSYPKYSEFVPLCAAAPLSDVAVPMRVGAVAASVPEPLVASGNPSAAPTPTSPLKASSPPLIPLRFYSIRECARLQGIPDSVSFEPDWLKGRKAFAINAAYKLIGNAVSPRVVQPLLASIIAALRNQALDAGVPRTAEPAN